jgi:hypothetical protein
MAKKEQKKPSKKSQTKGAAKSNKVGARAKKTKSFSVAEFADLTYLTENGVMQWLQQGLLQGQQDAKGGWQVDAANLEVPNVKRLVR